MVDKPEHILNELKRYAALLRSEYPGDLLLSEEVSAVLEKASDAISHRLIPASPRRPLIPEELEHVQQIDNSTCVHACLAMVTGDAIEDIVSVLGGAGEEDGLTTRDIYRYLMSRSIMPVLQDGTLISPFIYRGVYKVAVPSLNRSGRVHSVILTYDKHGGKTVYDPQRGRDGVKAYPPNAADQDSVVYFHPMETFLLMDMSY